MRYLLLSLTAFVLSLTCAAQQSPTVTANTALYDTIIKMDSILFHGFNTCDLEQFGAFFADDVEFYHDKGGLQTSKAAVIAATKKNICGKNITRELVKSSAHVYPVPGFGAIQEGQHQFLHNGKPEGHPMKFLQIWRLKDGVWQITRVVSYDH